MSKAQGQFTIIDYNDALTLTGYIGSNLAKTQMYNPDNGSYTPDWKTKNLVLTPSLYVIGTTADTEESVHQDAVRLWGCQRRRVVRQRTSGPGNAGCHRFVVGNRR